MRDLSVLSRLSGVNPQSTVRRDMTAYIFSLADAYAARTSGAVPMNDFTRTRHLCSPRSLCAAVTGWCLLTVAWCLPVPARALPSYSLAECLDLVARQNPDVIGAGKRVETAHAVVIQARSGVLPSLTTTGYYQRREQSVASNGGTQTNIRPDDYFADIRITQSLYSSGAVRNRIAAAKLIEQVAILDQQAALDTATFQVREAFYSTLAAEQSIGVRQQAIDLLGAQLKDQRDRLAAGSVGQINVNRAEVSLANERPALLQAQSNVRTAYATLSQVLALSYPKETVDPPFHVHGMLEYRPFSMSLEECLGRAAAMRPELQGRKIALDVLKHQMVVEKAGTRPSVVAFAAYDVYSQPSELAVKDNFAGYTIGLAASWTLFDGFATLGRVRGIRAQQGEAAAQLVATRLQVETDVRVAFDQLKTAESTLQPLSQNIALANETLGLATHNFDAGLNTQLDVLQSRVDLTRVQTTELGGRLAYNVALARLERAMAMGRPSQGSSSFPTTTTGPAPK